ncbi:MAG: hypothetical protein HY347_03900 [candidate division NC10 bacterium]|nr:hypothetical protein [candidate division NC10 bacterium]
MSYFKGSREQWKTGLSTYATLVYPDLWPGIDLVYSGTVNRLKYTFLVKPGADPSQIKLAYRGVTAVRLTEAGQLEVSTPVGRFQDDRPVSYQEVDGRRVEVPTAYALDPNATSESQVYGFSLGAYDQEKPLLLDLAVLIYAGYIGGDGSEWGFGIAVDRAGSAYITGGTTSTEATFPVTVGPDLTFNGDWDAFVAKIGELVGVPVSSIVPRSGGDTGPVSVVIHGFGFAEGATAKLVRAGQPDIVGDPVSVSPDGRTITTTFGLTGKALGLWDVVVTDPDGTSATLPEGFTIEEGRAPYVWMDILGWDQIRAGQKATYRIVFGNSGNVDWDGLAFIAIFVPVGIDTVTVKYNTLIVGEFAPQPQSPEALVGNLFSLPRLPALAQQGARLDISFTPPPSVTGGDIKVEVFPVPSKLPLEEDVLGAALLTLIQTKAIELGLEFPPVEELFLEALVKALQEFVIELTKKLVIVGGRGHFSRKCP